MGRLILTRADWESGKAREILRADRKKRIRRRRTATPRAGDNRLGDALNYAKIIAPLVKRRVRGERPEGCEDDRVFLLWRSARSRAKKCGVPFALRPADIVIPERCPVFGISLEMGRGRMTASSPTLDRIVPALGYVPGNVAVISWKANRLKSNATATDLRAIADWLDSLAEKDEAA